MGDAAFDDFNDELHDNECRRIPTMTPTEQRAMPDETTVEIALSLREAEWWPEGVSVEQHPDGGMRWYIDEDDLQRIAWAAAVWLLKRGWACEHGRSKSAPDEYWWWPPVTRPGDK